MRSFNVMILFLAGTLFTVTSIAANQNDSPFEIMPVNPKTGEMAVVSQDQANAIPDRKILYSVTQNDYVWKNGPVSFPRGTTYAVLEGNPYGVGSYTIRIKFPAHYRLPAHAHEDLEQVTVISGVLHIALGDKLKEGEGLDLPAGGFTVLTPNENHFEWTGDEGAIVQIHGIAPRSSLYVNKKDDPTGKQLLKSETRVTINHHDKINVSLQNAIRTAARKAATTKHKVLTASKQMAEHYTQHHLTKSLQQDVKMSANQAAVKFQQHHAWNATVAVTNKIAMPVKNAVYFTSHKAAMMFAEKTAKSGMRAKELASSVRMQQLYREMDESLD